MSYKGIKFNGKILDIPQEYLKSIDVTNGVLTIIDSNGQTYTFTVPDGVATESFVNDKLEDYVKQLDTDGTGESYYGFVYALDNSTGETIKIPYGHQPYGPSWSDGLVRRNNKQIKVELEPVSDNDAVSKKYTVDNFVGKVTEETTTEQVYAKDTDGTQKMISVAKVGGSYVGGGIPRYSDGGCITVGNPTYGAAATPKKYVDDKFNGASKPITYETYFDMIEAVNGLTKDEIKVGQDIMIVQTGIPDLWVAYVEDEKVDYSYVDDATFINELLDDGTVQVGYFKLGYLETQKIDTDAYVRTTNEAYKVYGTDDAGNQIKYPVSNWESGNTLALRNANGQLWSRVARTQERQTYNTEQGWLVHENYLTHYVDGRFLTGETDPTTETVGYQIGALYTNTSNNSTFVLDSITTDETTGVKTYNWVRLIRATDYAESTKAGLVKVSWGNSNAIMYRDTNGTLLIGQPTNAEIDARKMHKAILCSNLDYAIKSGLTKNTLTLTDEEKTKAKDWLGISGTGGGDTSQLEQDVANLQSSVDQLNMSISGLEGITQNLEMSLDFTNQEIVNVYQQINNVENNAVTYNALYQITDRLDLGLIAVDDRVTALENAQPSLASQDEIDAIFA